MTRTRLRKLRRRARRKAIRHEQPRYMWVEWGQLRVDAARARASLLEWYEAGLLEGYEGRNRTGHPWVTEIERTPL